MRHNLFLGGLLLLFTLIISATTLNSFPKKRCAPLTRAHIEEKLGKPVPCLYNAEGIECFGQGQIPGALVKFNASEQVKSLKLSDYCHGIEGIKEKLEEILPHKTRGKLRQKTGPPRPGLSWGPALGSCHLRCTEKYDCLTIDYWQNNSMGCAPASITVTWK